MVENCILFSHLLKILAGISSKFREFGLVIALFSYSTFSMHSKKRLFKAAMRASPGSIARGVLWWTV